MASSPFRIVEHVVPCQHIREYPGATAREQEDTLHLAVKQYIPLDNPNPQLGDVTILAAHANGFPKVWSTSRLLALWWTLAGVRANHMSGTIRTPLGRNPRSVQSQWVSHSKYLDGRCGAPGREQRHQ